MGFVSFVSFVIFVTGRRLVARQQA